MNTITHVRAKLSCHHTVEVPEGQPVGATVGCEKCPTGKGGEIRQRRIKRMLGVCPPPNDEPRISKPGEARERITRKAPDEDPELVAKLAASIEAAGGTVDEPPMHCTEFMHGGDPADQCARCGEAEDRHDTPQASTDRAERTKLAKEEWAALKAWNASDQSDPKPASPNLDAMNADYAAGVKPSKRGKTSTTKLARPEGHHFFRRGNQMADRHNRLSAVAWQTTVGLGEDGGRLSSEGLRQVLADAGITDPENTEWSYTLTNGVHIEAKIIGF